VPPNPAPQFPGLGICDDVRPAAWLEVGLRPWDQNQLLRISSLVPEGFAAYGRILHAAGSALGEGVVRWSDIATTHDRVLDAQTRFNELVGWDLADDRQPPWPWQQPDPGSLTPDECHAVADVLARHTSTPNRGWFCLWEGYGWTELPAPGMGPPRVRLEHRDCLLFEGAVSAAAAFRSGPWFQSPTLWWPDDHAWVVASELDIFSTYVAASGDCLAELIADPRLEVLACEVGQRIDPSPYPPRDEK